MAELRRPALKAESFTGISKASRDLGLSPRTLWQAIERGELPAHVFGQRARLKVADVRLCKRCSGTRARRRRRDTIDAASTRSVRRLPAYVCPTRASAELHRCRCGGCAASESSASSASATPTPTAPDDGMYRR